jgi:cobalt-zinc-cadmium efflux system protein
MADRHHDHDHDHAGHRHDQGHGTHRHSHARGASETRLGLAALLTGGFMFAEVVGGVISGSLALIADAGHMLTDFASLSLAWYGFHLSRRPADWKRTYGYDRFSILIAFANGLALFAIAAWIVFEAAHRLASPAPVLGGVMLAVAIAGLAINVLAFLLLRGGDPHNLNVRAALLHVLGDLLGSVAALVAGAVILLTGWTPIDPILSVVVALIILRSAFFVVRDSGHILLEGAPIGLDTRDIAQDLKTSVPEVVDVHHVHAWSISEDRPMVTLHARILETAQPEEVAAAVKGRLKRQFNVAHATVEIEFNGCADDAAPVKVKTGA